MHFFNSDQLNCGKLAIVIHFSVLLFLLRARFRRLNEARKRANKSILVTFSWLVFVLSDIWSVFVALAARRVALVASFVRSVDGVPSLCS